MGRSPLTLSEESGGVKKGPWTPEEDDKLINFIHKHGHASWRALPTLAGLNRCGKSCRLRWTNYLRPDIKRGKFSQDEEQTILSLHSSLGNKWSAIATHLPGRTDNEIKNFWNTHLKKKLIQMGFDPMTHRPRTDIFATLPHLLALANLFDNPEVLQMARLNQCLQHLLQLPRPIHNSTPNFPNAAAADLFKDTSILAQFENPAPSFSAAGQQYLEESVQFSHLPELQAPCSVDRSPLCINGAFAGVVGLGGTSDSRPWMQQSLSPSPPPVAAPGSDSFVSNALDECSTSSYGGGAAQMWSELFDDPIFHDIQL